MAKEKGSRLASQRRVTSKRSPIKRIEQQNQQALVKWFHLTYPSLKDNLTLASFGENIGARRMAQLKSMGLTPGYPDLFLSIPRITCTCAEPHKCYFGLYIEMKTKKGKLSAAQKKIHLKLVEQGYQVETCYDWIEAKDVILNYISPLKSQGILTEAMK